MLPRGYGQVCSIARTLELVGDRWTLLIIRDAFLGMRRFDAFLDRLGIARNVLSDRLSRLCEDGILERRPYQDHPVRYEYHLTPKGVDLWPLLMAALLWGDKHTAADGAPVLVRHRGCGGRLVEPLHCGRCGTRLTPGDVEVEAGPGAGRPVPAAT
jgi:DNA-binding HxlR family transcriptional regulator